MEPIWRYKLSWAHSSDLKSIWFYHFWSITPIIIIKFSSLFLLNIIYWKQRFQNFLQIPEIFNIKSGFKNIFVRVSWCQTDWNIFIVPCERSEIIHFIFFNSIIFWGNRTESTSFWGIILIFNNCKFLYFCGFKLMYWNKFCSNCIIYWYNDS